LTEDASLIETAGSVSIAGSLSIRSEELLSWPDLEEVAFFQKIRAPKKVKFWRRARGNKAFANFPSAIGDSFETRSLSSVRQVSRRAGDCNLAIA